MDIDRTAWQALFIHGRWIHLLIDQVPATTISIPSQPQIHALTFDNDMTYTFKRLRAELI
jgi:hypothetical protein